MAGRRKSVARQKIVPRSIRAKDGTLIGMSCPWPGCDYELRAAGAHWRPSATADIQTHYAMEHTPLPETSGRGRLPE